MNDDFFKTIQIVQSTGQAPILQNQTTKETISSATLITEAQIPTAKTYRFTSDGKDSDIKKNNG